MRKHKVLDLLKPYPELHVRAQGIHGVQALRDFDAQLPTARIFVAAANSVELVGAATADLKRATGIPQIVVQAALVEAGYALDTRFPSHTRVKGRKNA